MPAAVTVDFKRLVELHKSSDDIGKIVTDIPKYVNETCCVQISYALNRSGGAIHEYRFPDPTLNNNHVNAFKSKDNYFYIFGVPDMKIYLNNVYGKAENYKGSKDEMIAKIQGRTGLLAFGHRHIDIWLEDHWHLQRHYYDLWTFPSTQLRGCFFWEASSTGDN